MALTRGFPVHAAITPALDLRLELAGLVVANTAGVPRAGVFPDRTTQIVFGNAGSMSVAVVPFVAALTRGKPQGVSLIANDADTLVPLDAAPSANARIDVVYVRQNDNVDAADANANAIFGVAKGTASPSPSVPAVPVGALPLAQVRIPAGVVDIDPANGALTTQVYPYTATTGGVVLFRNSTERDGWAAGEGQPGFQLDTGLLYIRRGGAWAAFTIDDTTGWTFLSPAPGWNVNASAPYPGGMVRIKGDMVQLRGLVGKNSGIINQDDAFATLPLGFRPTTAVDFPVRQGLEVRMARCETSGLLRFTSGGASVAVLAGEFPR